MSKTNSEIQFDIAQVNRLWLHQQGLGKLTKRPKLSKPKFREHLETTGALQIDSINVVERAHYLTLWSRFGKYRKETVDDWVYKEKIAYEYWGHEASLLPKSHFHLSQRRMRKFPPSHWKESAWWSRFQTSAASKRRVLKRIAAAGPLESVDFEPRVNENGAPPFPGWGTTLSKEDKRSLQLLWHAGKIGVSNRRHFRKVYNLAEHIYPESDPASTTEFEDSWLLTGLAGNGVASESHLVNYFTAPGLKAERRANVIARNLKQKRIVKVRVRGMGKPFYALPEHLEKMQRIEEPTGTALICPFDSLLWQRKRAEELLGFRYRVEIYVPSKKREFGYYVLPILYDGSLVGRLDPKFDRSQKKLLIHSIYLEPGFKRNKRFDKALQEQLQSLADFLGASTIDLPSGWRS